MKEPLGGAHRNHQLMAQNLKEKILDSINELENKSSEELKNERYKKFRQMGVFCS